jgi:hypothetical protein
MRRVSIGLRPHDGGWALVLVVLCLTGGCTSGHNGEKRRFGTAEAAISQLREHEPEFRELAEEWLRDGQAEFCHFDADNYEWNDYRVRVTDSGREIIHFDGQEWVSQFTASFDDAARLAGATPGSIRHWLAESSKLAVDCVSLKDVELPAGRLRYVELEFFPVRHPYGFRFAPDDGMRRELAAAAAKSPQTSGQEFVALGGPWFYFEGR